MTESTFPGSAPAQPSRWKWLLIASLALNLLVAGAIAGRVVFGPHHGPGRWGQAPGDFGLMGFSKLLPSDRQTLVRQNLRAARPEFRELRAETVELRKQAADVLLAEPFDKAALKAALDRVGAGETRVRDKGVDVFVDTAGQLTPDERKTLAEAWKKRLEQRPKGRKKRDGMEAPGE